MGNQEQNLAWLAATWWTASSRARGIRDERVLEAMSRLPRERFVPPDQHAAAYEDRPLPIGAGQTISQPYIVALMTQELALAPGHRVLEIGTGSGYQTAILAELAAEVYTIERVAELADGARERLAELGILNVRLPRGRRHPRLAEGRPSTASCAPPPARTCHHAGNRSWPTGDGWSCR